MSQKNTITLRFQLVSKFKGKKTKNARTNGKEKVRAGALAFIDNANVLELFCGRGVMYTKVWNKCNSYVGIDIEPQGDARRTITSDALEYVKKANIKDINTFDIDAFGSPYQCLEVIVQRIENEYNNGRIAFCITDGLEIDMRMGNITSEMAALADINVKKVKNAHLMHDNLIKRIIKNIAKRLDSVVLSAVICRGNTGSGMRYYCFVLEKNTKGFL